MDKRIKIIHIIPTLDMGGAERSVVDLLKTLDKARFEVKLIAMKRAGHWAAELESAGIEVIVLGQKDRLGFLVLPELAAILKREEPDIVHTHLFGGDFFGRLAAGLAGVARVVSTEHNLNRSESRFKKILKGITSAKVETVIASSQAIKDYVIAHEGVAAEKVSLIPYGVDADKFVNPDRAYGKKAVIGSIGRLTEQKGFDRLIKALSLAKDEHLICRIAGAGELKDALAGEIASSGLGGTVSLVGHVDSKKFLAEIDIFVLPSRWEGLGIVLLEAGLSGLPVIASAVDGIKEVIESPDEGILMDTSDPAALSLEIRRLASDPGLRRKLGTNLQKKIRERFTLEKMARGYEAVYLKK